MESFSETFRQLVILFGFIGIGALAWKLKLWGRDGINQITTFVLYFVMPMLMVESMQMPVSLERIRNGLLAALYAVITYLISIVLAKLLLPPPDRAKRVYSFAVVLGNVGFMGIPLVSLLVGAEGVFYTVIFVMIFHIVTWTYGVSVMQKDRPGFHFSWKKALVNPGVLPVTFAILLYVSGIRFPEIVMIPVRSIASLNRPLGMMIVGAEIAAVSLGSFWKDRGMYIAAALRLLILPAIFLPLALLFANDRIWAYGVFIPAIIPTAANIMMFASRYEQDTLSAARALTAITLVSLITIPFWVWLLGVLGPA